MTAVAPARAAFFWLLFVLFLAGPLIAQQRIPAAGRVILAGPDSLPVPRVPLVLHRVGRTVQGPVDSTISDAGGRFRLRFAADTNVLYLLSARYAGIEYFSPPLNTNPSLPDTALIVAVFDTSSTQTVSEVARYLVIRRAGTDGSRGVLDLIVLENRGMRTRLARDSTDPAWSGRLPIGVSGIRVGEADLSTEAIVIRDDSILVFAPIAPGEKQIALEYALPPGAPLRLTFDQDSVATNVLTQDPATRVDGSDMIAVDSQLIEGQTFQRWVGAPHRGDELRVSFGSRGGVPTWVLPAMVGLAAVGLVIALIRLLPRRPTESLEALTDRIAELEARYADRRAEVGDDEWLSYERERDQLRTALAARLEVRRKP